MKHPKIPDMPAGVQLIKTAGLVTQWGLAQFAERKFDAWS
jgi:hypothetical protein